MTKKIIKKVNVSPKRQITIPKEFYDRMDIRGNKVQLILDGTRMIVEPTDIEEDLFDFTDQMKMQLEKEGYSGKKLAQKLAEQKKLVDRAFELMIKEAREEYRNGKTVSHDELFSEIEGE